jgi:hypothetical protein
MLLNNYFSQSLHEIYQSGEQNVNLDYLLPYSIDLWELTPQIDVVACRRAKAHRDEPYPEFSVICVFQNEGLIAKGVKQRSQDWLEQKPGTILLFNIHRVHHCVKDPRARKHQGFAWAGLSMSFDKASDIPSLKDIETQLITFEGGK